MPPNSQRVVVEIPNEATERPAWTRVGIIALVGFVVGIAWPKIAGYQLGPAPPQDERHSAAPGSASAGDDPEASGSRASPVAAVPSGSSAAGKSAEPVQVQTVVVKGTDVFSCRDGKDKVADKCDRPDLDSLLVSRVQDLARCPSAAGLLGKLSIGFDVDFKRNRVQLLRGKTTTIPRTTIAGIWECAAKAIEGVSLEGMKHEQQRYTVFYAAHFFPPGRVIDGGAMAGALTVPEDSSAKAESNEAVIGTAQIVYDTVLVREEPKTGAIVARLVRGTRVELLRKQASWYKIKFNDREGWVYRGAIAQ